jgi:uncharacterized protein DUF4412
MSLNLRAARWSIPAVIGIATLIAARPDPRGISYTFTMSSHAVDFQGRTRDQAPMQGHLRYEGDKARVDIVSSDTHDTTMWQPGDFMLLDTTARTMTMVHAKSKTYTVIPLDAMQNMMGMAGAMAGGMMKTSFTDLHHELQKLGPETVNGIATQHYRQTMDMKVMMQIMFMKTNSQSHTVSDYWLAPELKHVRNPLFEMFGSMGEAFMQGNKDLADTLKMLRQQVTDGMPVKVVSHGESTDDKGKKSVHDSQYEVTNFTRADIDEDVFEVPKGFTEDSTRMQMQNAMPMPRRP